MALVKHTYRLLMLLTYCANIRLIRLSLLGLLLFQIGKTSGAKPGTSLQKLYPYVRTMLDTMRSRMGYGAFKIALDDGLQGTIEVQELESIRGRSFDERLIFDP